MIIIGLTGKKESGKDTVVRIVAKYLDPSIKTYKLAFATEVKRKVAEMLGVSLQEIEDNKEMFRLILQGYGTDYCRKNFGENYWIGIWQKKLELLRNEVGRIDILFVPDIRFENEFNMLQKENALIFRVDAINKSRLSKIDIHPSEQGDFPVDGVLLNDFSDINILVKQVKEQIIDKITKNI